MAYNYQPPYQAQPPPPQPYYPPPQPMQQPYGGVPSVDQFRGDYASRLASLTVNSRPIIQDLSILAMQERDRRDWAKMNVVVQEIEAAVQRVSRARDLCEEFLSELLQAPPGAKLPLIYLVDSISKNVGAPYTTQLLPYIIPRMFLTAYREVDGVTRAKMEEMVGLWRRAGPDGGDLYGREVRDAVERELFGTGGQPGLRGPFPTREMALQKCQAVLTLKNREFSARPWETNLGRNIETLQRISGMVSNTPLQPQQLQEIMETLQGMTPTQPPQMAPPMAPQYQAAPPYYSAPVQQLPVPPLAQQITPPAAGMPPFPPQLPRDQYGAPLAPTMRSPHMPVPTPPYAGPSTPQPAQAPTPQPAAPVIPVDVAALLSSLNSGVLNSAPRTPESDTVKLDKPKTSLEKYEDMILGTDMRLESLDMNKCVALHTNLGSATDGLRHRMTFLPTSHLPQRCTQCGLRFSDVEGVMPAHLDWHFRRNRKQRESEGRGAHRRWLPRAEVGMSSLFITGHGADTSQEWIEQSVVAEAGPSTTAPTSKLTADRIVQLKKKRVKVPSDPDIAARPCPVCKEPFKAEWSEEDEEWVWHNAIDINVSRRHSCQGNPEGRLTMSQKAGDKSQIYHATCRAEQMNARVANRLLKDGERRTGSKSPRLTPGLQDLDIKTERERTPTSTGKRKAETEESESKRVKVEPVESPKAEQGKEAVDGPVANGMAVDMTSEPAATDPQPAIDVDVPDPGVTEAAKSVALALPSMEDSPQDPSTDPQAQATTSTTTAEVATSSGTADRAIMDEAEEKVGEDSAIAPES